jgi:hypothetical protein
VGDSLVSKVETVLRKMDRGLGIADIKSLKRDGKVVDEYVGLDITRHPKIRAAIGADLYEFVTYVLDRTGERFRDRVARGARLHMSMALRTSIW